MGPGLVVPTDEPPVRHRSEDLRLFPDHHPRWHARETEDGEVTRSGNSMTWRLGPSSLSNRSVFKRTHCWHYNRR